MRSRLDNTRLVYREGAWALVREDGSPVWSSIAGFSVRTTAPFGDDAPFPDAPGPARDAAILSAVQSGAAKYAFANVTSSTPDGHTATFRVFGDALQIPSSTSATGLVRVSVSAALEQTIADLLDCSLLTAKLADLLFQQRTVTLTPHTQTPDATMVTSRVMAAQSAWIDAQLAATGGGDDGIVQTVGKHWIVDNLMLTKAAGKARDGRPLAINYGWHMVSPKFQGASWPKSITLPDAYTVQNRGWAHSSGEADYSQNCVLVSNDCMVDGQPMRLQDVLRDPALSLLANHDGVLRVTRQPGVPVTPPLQQQTTSMSGESGEDLAYHVPTREPDRLYKLVFGDRTTVFGDDPSSHEGDARFSAEPTYTPNGQNLGDTLQANWIMRPGMYLSAMNGSYFLVFDTDGSFVLRDARGVALWNPGTKGASLVSMLPDGNLVVTDAAGNVKWASGTNARAFSSYEPNQYVVLQDDGNIVMHGPSHGQLVWAANTYPGGGGRLAAHGEGEETAFGANTGHPPPAAVDHTNSPLFRNWLAKEGKRVTRASLMAVWHLTPAKADHVLGVAPAPPKPKPRPKTPAAVAHPKAHGDFGGNLHSFTTPTQDAEAARKLVYDPNWKKNFPQPFAGASTMGGGIPVAGDLSQVRTLASFGASAARVYVGTPGATDMDMVGAASVYAISQSETAMAKVSSGWQLLESDAVKATAEISAAYAGAIYALEFLGQKALIGVIVSLINDVIGLIDAALIELGIQTFTIATVSGSALGPIGVVIGIIVGAIEMTVSVLSADQTHIQITNGKYFKVGDYVGHSGNGGSGGNLDKAMAFFKTKPSTMYMTPLWVANQFDIFIANPYWLWTNQDKFGMSWPPPPNQGQGDMVDTIYTRLPGAFEILNPIQCAEAMTSVAAAPGRLPFYMSIPKPAPVSTTPLSPVGPQGIPSKGHGVWPDPVVKNWKVAMFKTAATQGDQSMEAINSPATSCPNLFSNDIIATKDPVLGGKITGQTDQCPGVYQLQVMYPSLTTHDCQVMFAKVFPNYQAVVTNAAVIALGDTALPSAARFGPASPKFNLGTFDISMLQSLWQSTQTTNPTPPDLDADLGANTFWNLPANDIAGIRAAWVNAQAAWSKGHAKSIAAPLPVRRPAAAPVPHVALPVLPLNFRAKAATLAPPPPPPKRAMSLGRKVALGGGIGGVALAALLAWKAHGVTS